MAQLMEKGALAKAPVSKPLGDQLFELRGDVAGEHVRFVYFFQPGKKIIFVVGAFKDQPTLPRRVRERALKIRATLVAEPELMDGLVEVH